MQTAQRRFFPSRALATGLALLSFALIQAPAFADDAKVALDPYRIPTLTDANSKRWDFREDGSLNDGTNDCFDGAYELQVNGLRLRYLYRPQRRGVRPAAGKGMWFKKGGTYIIGPLDFAGNANQGLDGLKLTRYISLTPDRKWLRFIELWENTGNAERTITMEIHSDYGSTLQRQRTSSKGANWGSKDWGTSYVQRSGRPAVVRVLRAKKNRKVELAVGVSGDNSVETYSNIKVAARKKVAILHFVAQVNAAQDIDAALKSFKASAMTKDIPFSLRRYLINFSFGIAIEGLSVPREQSSDLVVLRSGKNLLGTLTDKSFEVKTIAGSHTIPLDMVIGIEVRGTVDEPKVLVGCRDGQVFSGTLKNSQVGFRLGGGQQLKIKLGKIQSFGVHASEDEARAKEVKTPERFIKLRTGDVLGLDDLQEPIQLVTQYGQLTTKLGQVQSLVFEEEGNWGHSVQLTNRSRFGCLVTNSSLKCLLSSKKKAEGTEPVVIRRDLILTIAAVKPLEEVLPPAGHFELGMRNGDELVCKLEESSVGLESDFGEIELKTSNLKTVTVRSQGLVDIKLWDGSDLSGALNKPLLKMSMSGLALQVPLTLIGEAVQRSFKLPADLEKEVLATIANLDAGDIDEREHAEGVLKKLGAIIRPYVVEATRKKGVSPEMSKRLAAVLKELGSAEETDKVNLVEFRKQLVASKDDKKRAQRGVVRALKAIWRSQRIFHGEDRDKDNVQNYGTLEKLHKFVGKAHGIDDKLGKGEKHGYVFKTGPSSNDRAAEYLWWATAVPKDGKGPHFFMHHSGTIFVTKKPFKVNTETCDPPSDATRLEE